MCIESETLDSIISVNFSIWHIRKKSELTQKLLCFEEIFLLRCVPYRFYAVF